ncbi:MAG: corrinoid protein [Candidatus Marinimicrobia bacterium]|nr:corrinoid protein [Candidatus Neomarinimicrobiota bacterium]
MLDEISEAIQNMKEDEILDLVERALEEGLSPEKILNNGMIGGMSIIGKKFKEGEIFIPEVMLSARTMQKGLERLEPLLAQSGVKKKGKVLIGTVKDDMHDIGKNIVSIMFKGAGFEVIDLGTNVSADEFIDKAYEIEPDIIGLSALLTTTMKNMKMIVKQLLDEDLDAYIMIGGAPVTQDFAASINANYAKNAAEAVEKAQAFIKSKIDM